MAEPSTAHANFEGNIGKTSSVGAYPQGNTPEGLCDMAGNVWEWCISGDLDAQVLRGGSWGSGSEALRAAYRYTKESDDTTSFGFRLARAKSHLKSSKITA